MRALVLLLALLAGPLQAQEVLRQLVDDGPAQPMSAEDVAALADPFARNVLMHEPPALRLAAIEAALIGPPEARSGRRLTFVVSERIHEPGGPPGVTARSVIAFEGRAPNGDALAGDVFLSTSFDPQARSFPEEPHTEALAWDDVNGVYNYYRLDPDEETGALLWRFRGSSRDADLLTTEERAGTCFRCHSNGAPVMKELLFPWNNWHGAPNPVDGLVAFDPARRWPIASSEEDDHLKGDQLGDAATLEGLIASAIERFNGARVQALTREDGEGRRLVPDARRLLRPLFEDTELNLISARQQSGLHPIGGPAHHTGRPGAPVAIPNSFFADVALIAGGLRIQGLGIDEAGAFESMEELQIAPAEYADLLRKQGQRLGDISGDAEFAWFGPEPSFIDNDMVEQLMDEGVLTPQFVAAVLAVDSRWAILSEDRAGLLRFVPDSFAYRPLAGSPRDDSRHPDALTRAVIANIEAAAPAGRSAAADFLGLLRLEDPREALRLRIIDFQDILRLQAGSEDAMTRQQTLEALWRELDERRDAFRRDPRFAHLVESEVLLPDIE